jgi:hypothetical protein
MAFEPGYIGGDARVYPGIEACIAGDGAEADQPLRHPLATIVLADQPAAGVALNIESAQAMSPFVHAAPTTDIIRRDRTQERKTLREKNTIMRPFIHGTL